jgi:hypothetical protein
MEIKSKLKNDQMQDLGNFFQKKQIDDLKRDEERKNYNKLIEGQIRKQEERDNEYRNKLNQMNDKVYDHGLKHTGYLQNHSNSPTKNEPFHVRNDHEFNRKLAEMRANEKGNLKNDQTLVQERMREMEINKDLDARMKSEKMDHQKLYKDFLDKQKGLKSQFEMENSNQPEGEKYIMPSYKYPNRAQPTNKRAKDTIEMVKNNTLFPESEKDMKKFFSWEAQYETLIDYGNKNYYLGDTRLKHNPITHPVNDSEYNRYLLKLKHNAGGNQGMIQNPSNNNINGSPSKLINAGTRVLG